MNPFRPVPPLDFPSTGDTDIVDPEATGFTVGNEPTGQTEVILDTGTMAFLQALYNDAHSISIMIRDLTRTADNPNDSTIMSLYEALGATWDSINLLSRQYGQRRLYPHGRHR